MAETKVPAGADKAASLTPEEQAKVRQSDTADTARRAPGPDTSGKRVRCIFYGGSISREVSKRDFKSKGIDHPSVVWDYWVDDATLPVDPPKGKKGLSSEAAEFLTSEYPEQFEYMSD